MSNNKQKQVNIRITNKKNLDIFSEWEGKYHSSELDISKNKTLENLLIKAINYDLLENKTDYLEQKFQNIFEKNINHILKRVFARQDLITLNLIKFLKIDELKSNYLLSQLFESGIIKDNAFTDPHKQQLSDAPWVRKQKNNLDSEFAYLQKTEIIKDFASIGKESFVLQKELEDDLNKTIELINKDIDNKLKKHNLQLSKKITKERRNKNDN